MARTLTVELGDGKSLVVRSLPLKKQSLLVGIVGDVVEAISGISEGKLDGIERLVDQKWERVEQLIQESLEQGTVDDIEGLDATVDVLSAIFEVNGGTNLLKRLGGLTQSLGATLGVATQAIQGEEILEEA